VGNFFDSAVMEMTKRRQHAIRREYWNASLKSNLTKKNDRNSPEKICVTRHRTRYNMARGYLPRKLAACSKIHKVHFINCWMLPAVLIEESRSLNSGQSIASKWTKLRKTYPQIVSQTLRRPFFS
jgi:hypothetical protein